MKVVISMKDRASGRFLLRMEPGLHAALREAARAAGLSLNEHCVRKLALPPTTGEEPAVRVVMRATEIVGPSLAGVAVFGSYGRGEATETSDVDVLVVVDEGQPITRELYRRWDEVPLRWDGKRVEPHFVRLPDARERSSGFWAEIAIDGVVLFERHFELSHRLALIRAQIAGGRIVRRRANGNPYWVTV
jgi:predicted nucleotidyltransferase